VEDWFSEGAPERRIALDPKLDGAANLERLFTRAKKLERAQASLERERELAGERIAGLEALLARVPDESPELVEREAMDAGLLDRPQPPPKQRSAPAARLPYKRFLATSGAEIWVGRSARDNDELSMRLSRGNDVWLHTADAPGSHVVLRTEKGVDPSEEDVQDAAQLAVHFSPLRGARRTDVHVARCKEVHKPRGAKPGLVTLSGGRTRHVRLDEQRLRRLLSPERAAREAEGR